MKLKTLLLAGLITMICLATYPLWPDDRARAEPAAQPGLRPVLELFTSQGCSSCPPADRLLRKMVKTGEVIALSYNVDYWNYLGWKDTLSQPGFSERQRRYALERRDHQVYTPQLVVNGMVHVVGSKARQIEQAIRATGQRLRQWQIAVHTDVTKGQTQIHFDRAPAALSAALAGAKPAKKLKATIWMAAVRGDIAVDIRRGENKGRKLHYCNVVRKLKKIGVWEGTPVSLSGMTLKEMRASGADRCVILVQLDGYGPIIGAVEMKLPQVR